MLCFSIKILFVDESNTVTETAEEEADVQEDEEEDDARTEFPDTWVWDLLLTEYVKFSANPTKLLGHNDLRFLDCLSACWHVINICSKLMELCCEGLEIHRRMQNVKKSL